MADEKSVIKILISYHKESQIIQSKTMLPIQVGAKNSPLDLGIRRDDEGDNISDKNGRYCELTAQYWAWKNLDADYYGFMHYRRHFVFRDHAYPTNDYVHISYPCITEDYKNEIGLCDAEITRCVEGCDLILPVLDDVSQWGYPSLEVHYCKGLYQHAADFDLVCRKVMELYPDYSEAVQAVRTGRTAYWFNMFIMRKALFMEYSQWLFRILAEVEKKIDFTNYNRQERRVLAFMAERLFTIYVVKLLKDRPALKVRHLKVTLVANTDPDSGEYLGMPEDEKAYREMSQLSLPYDMESIFPVKDYPFRELLSKKELKLYGAGNAGRQVLSYFDRLGLPRPKEIWDKAAREGQTVCGVPVTKPRFDSLRTDQNTLWVITILNSYTRQKVQRLFASRGITNLIDYDVLSLWLTYQAWLLEQGKLPPNEVESLE